MVGVNQVFELAIYNQISFVTSCDMNGPTVKPVCNGHLNHKIYHLWFIQ